MSFSFLISSFLLCSPIQAKHQLIINVADIKVTDGFIRIALFDSDKTFLSSKAFAAEEFRVGQSKHLKCTFEIPFGEYAFTLYHDENSDGKINKNFLGIPNEPYGFSNNLSAMFGPPSWEKAKLIFDKEHYSFDISLR